MINIEGTEITDINLGSTPVQQVYLGNDLVWEKYNGPDLIEIDYLENTSTAYIDTGYKSENYQLVKIEVQFMCNTVSTEQQIFGCRSKSGTVAASSYNYTLQLKNSSFIQGHRNSFQTISNIVPDNTTVYTAVKNGRVIEINEQTASSKEANSFTNNRSSIFLFNISQPTYYAARVFRGKIFYCKIWDNNVLVRDFVPRYQRSTKMYGLYDRVNDVFYTSATSTVFTGG